MDGTVIEAGCVVLAAGTYASPPDPRPLGYRSRRPAASARHHARHRPARGRLEPRRPPTALYRSAGSTLLRPEPAPSPRHASLSAADLAGPADLLIFAAGPFEVGADPSASGAVLGIVSGLTAPRSRGWVQLAADNPTDETHGHPPGSKLGASGSKTRGFRGVIPGRTRSPPIQPKKAPEQALYLAGAWRRRRESNPGTGLCRPLPKPLGHAASTPPEKLLHRSGVCPVTLTDGCDDDAGSPRREGTARTAS